MNLQADPRAKALIFDLDGTLIDSLEINWQAMDTALREQGIVISRDEFCGMTGRSLEEIARLLANKYRPEADIQAIIQRKRQIANSHIDDVLPIEAVANVARQCFGKIPMAVGTGSDRFRAIGMLKSSGLFSLFDCIVAADDVQNHKPAPDTFLKCAQILGVEPHLCQVFEDGDTGLVAARAAGMIDTDVRPFI